MVLRLVVSLAPAAVVGITTSVQTTTSKVAPVLEVLRKEVTNQQNSGEALAAEYTKTACECNRVQEEKEGYKTAQESLILEKEASCDGLKAQIEALETGIAENKSKIVESKQSFSDHEGWFQSEIDRNSKALKELEMNLIAVEQAKDVLGSSFDRPTDVEPAMDILMQIPGGDKIAALVQAKGGSSEQILDIMGEIEQDFSNEIAGRNGGFTDHKNFLSHIIQQSSDDVASLEKQVARDEAYLTSFRDTLADDNQQLASARQQNQITTEFLEAKYGECENEKTAYDAEQTTRKEALTVLTQIIERISQVDPDDHASLLDMSVSSRFTNFLQLGSMTRRSPMDEATQIISTAAQRFGSDQLSTLATTMSAGGPFDSVSTMIQGLINKMDEEIKAQTDQHMYCEQQKEEHTNKVGEHFTCFSF